MFWGLSVEGIVSMEDIRKKYLDNPHECPFCESSDISCNGKEWGDDDYILVYMDCESCNASWSELFTMTGACDFERGNVGKVI